MTKILLTRGTVTEKLRSVKQHYETLPKVHHGNWLGMNDRAKSIQCVIEWDIRELFSNHSQHALHPACCAKLARSGQLLQSRHKYLVMQRSTPDGPSNLCTYNDLVQAHISDASWRKSQEEETTSLLTELGGQLHHNTLVHTWCLCPQCSHEVPTGGPCGNVNLNCCGFSPYWWETPRGCSERISQPVHWNTSANLLQHKENMKTVQQRNSIATCTQHNIAPPPPLPPSTIEAF